jgi:hypothetical protein
LRFAEAEFFLEVLVHDIDHAVAEAPEQEQGGDERERESDIAAAGDGE